MKREELIDQIIKKRSCLCVGLDTDITKIPNHLKQAYEDPVLEFNKAIIDATKDYAVAYKLNTAFYESQGIPGWVSFQKTLEYIPKDIFTIADAKRGDIGNTSEQYAKTFFHTYPFHAMTVAPYMGSDSVQPFLKFADKWTILLGLTSNEGSKDFQWFPSKETPLFKEVLRISSQWGSIDNMMYVVGATRAEQLAEIRDILPDHFLLVPGVGSQGGSLYESCKYGMNMDCGILVNNSRAIIFASSGEDFAEAAAREAQNMQQEMEKYLIQFTGLISVSTQVTSN